MQANSTMLGYVSLAALELQTLMLASSWLLELHMCAIHPSLTSDFLFSCLFAHKVCLCNSLEPQGPGQRSPRWNRFPRSMEHLKNITKEPAKSYKLQIQRLFRWQSREGAQPRLGHSQTETAGPEPLGMPLHPAKRLGGKEEANSGTANYHSCHSQELGDLKQQADLYRSGQTQNQARIRQEHQPLQERTGSTSEESLGGAPKQHRYFTKGTSPPGPTGSRDRMLREALPQ